MLFAEREIIKRLDRIIEILERDKPKLVAPVAELKKLKKGVKITKNGTFFIPGKGFIKKENAYE